MSHFWHLLLLFIEVVQNPLFQLILLQIQIFVHFNVCASNIRDEFEPLRIDLL